MTAAAGADACDGSETSPDVAEGVNMPEGIGIAVGVSMPEGVDVDFPQLAKTMNSDTPIVKHSFWVFISPLLHYL
jgi:hypothetical protein